MPEDSAPLSRQSEMTVVPILGMHRSGTSMFTRALALLGMELGGPLMPPQPDNPKGFWENEFFWGVNVQVLRAMGLHMSGYGRARDLLAIPERCSLVERTDETLRGIEAYLDRTFQSPTWGWKDPRTVLLFPFWLAVLTDLGYGRIQPAVVARHPAACVRSLAKRGDLQPAAAPLGLSPEALALEMWKAYSQALLAICDVTDCYLTLHEWLIDRDTAAPELVRCAEYVGLGRRVDLRPALDWVDPSSVHHTGSDDQCDEEALALHAQFVARARAQQSAWTETDPVEIPHSS